MLGHLPWKVRAVLAVPALVWFGYAADEFGQSVGLIAKRPTTLSATIDAPREYVFAAFLTAAQLSPGECASTCRSTIAASDGPYRLVFELSRPDKVSRRIIAKDGSIDATINWDLQEDGERTHITSSVVVGPEIDARKKEVMEHGYEKWGRTDFETIVSEIEDAAKAHGRAES